MTDDQFEIIRDAAERKIPIAVRRSSGRVEHDWFLLRIDVAYYGCVIAHRPTGIDDQTQTKRVELSELYELNRWIRAPSQ